MARITLLLILVLSAAAHSQTAATKTPNPCNQPTVDERLQRYFDNNEVAPWIVINNVDQAGRGRSWKDVVLIGKHSVAWEASFEGTASKLSVKMDGRPLNVRSATSLNPVDGERRDKLDYVSDWDQIKLYRFGDGRELITVTMLPEMCTGLMCGVAAQLVYDPVRNTSNFFGTFRADLEAKLFRFKNDDQIYYLSKTFTGDAHRTVGPSSVIYRLWAVAPDGHLTLQNRSDRKSYELRHTQEIEDSGRPDTLDDSRWVEKIP
jgi:hypothetical protein